MKKSTVMVFKKTDITRESKAPKLPFAPELAAEQLERGALPWLVRSTYLFSLTLELLIQLLSLVVPAMLLYSTRHSVFLLLPCLALSYYLYPFFLLLFSAATGRLLPKPRLGILTTSRDRIRYVLLGAISQFVRRSPGRWLAFIFPFPGSLYYRIWGGGGAPERLYQFS